MASDADLTLASSNTANATQQYWIGGRGVFMAEASAFGTVTLQYQSPNGTWLNVGSDAVLAANGMVGVELPPGKVRVALSGTTAAAAYLYGSRID